MDAPDADRLELRRSLAFIRRVNAMLGYTRATLGHLDRFSRRWKAGQTIRILDVATGSADIPLAIARWARRGGWDVRMVGVDLHAGAAQAARDAIGAADAAAIRIARADALRLPFADGGFDYCLSSMFLHHLDEADAVAALREMDRVASRGLIAADLLRRRRAYAWITLLTALAGPMVRHDARASVAQAFNAPEVLHLRDQAGLHYTQLYHHFGHRFSLAGEKA